MTYYPHDGEPLTKEELFEEITRVWREDREEARQMVYLNRVSWFELAEWQRAKREGQQ